MTKFFSASTNGFYSEEMNGDAIPEDSVEITDDEWGALLDGQSKGKLITSDKKGFPILKDYPAPTSKQLIEMAEVEKAKLIAIATVAINPLQDAVDLEIATDEEAASLKAWKTYRVMVNRVDTSKAPDIDWPKSPE
ncbi:tail fiber assembly protein [uncultured Pantoea sp.]|uniref:tail fiber assembly protein n=1 Tax=uncultured Pantoea sp. TaxID=218084 RepID=UPI002063CC33|nr:tail fiber assembly protein [uncultured Pantoea sp.]DAL09337.1 MAG TPA_asm: tail fiber assembly protein [Caudoviricetes sp.]